MASDNVTIATDESLGEAISHDNPTLVYFWAPWCGPCRMVGPAIDQIADEQVGDVNVVKVNIEDAPLAEQTYEIKTTPTMIIFNNAEPVSVMVGAKPKQAILDGLAAV